MTVQFLEHETLEPSIRQIVRRDPDAEDEDEEDEEPKEHEDDPEDEEGGYSP